MLHVISLPCYSLLLVLGHVSFQLLDVPHQDFFSSIQIYKVWLLDLMHFAASQMEHVLDSKCIFVHIVMSVECVQCVLIDVLNILQIENCQ